MRASALALLALLLVPATAAHHAAPSGEREVAVLAEGPAGTTWRAVAFAPDGSHALVVGKWSDGERTRDLVARWTPDEGLEEVYNRSGTGLVDVGFHPDGTSLVVGIRNTLLLGRPGAYRNVWNDTEFARSAPPLDFFGLRGAFRPGEDSALVAGSSLLRLDLDGAITVVHGGRGAFFRSLAWNPSAPYALVEVALDRDGQALLGAVWRTNGQPPLGQEDNVAIYGRFTPGASLLNTIAFAPNGSYALLAGRDGAGASFLTWSSKRADCHRHEDGACHDHRWQYLASVKQQGPVTCAAWHPSGRYALTTGLDRDVVGFAGARAWAPVLHAGPDLFGCAFHPSGAYALAVGEHGALARITPDGGPLGAVVAPDSGALVPPHENATFLVGTILRAPSEGVAVSGVVEGQEARVTATPDGPWWRVVVDATELKDGTHTLAVTINASTGSTTFSHPFLVNNERFTPERPRILEPLGLEGRGADADGRFTLRWERLDAPVVYEVQERTTASGANVSRVLQAGPRDNLTVKVTSDGSYLYRVRARNAFNASAWSAGVVVNVILDSDGDGVPDSKDPRPFLADTWGDQDGDGVGDDAEYVQCSDANDATSTPGTDDDGDGIPNGIECSQGTDPLDTNDPPRQDEDGVPDDGDDEEENGSPLAGLLVVLAALCAAAVLRHR